MSVDVGRVGIWCSSRIWPQDAGAVAEAAADVEALGYRALWLGMSPAGTLEQPESLLAATSTLAVATGIVSVWDLPAASVARAYHRLAAAYPTRFLLGLGASHPHVVERSGRRYLHPYSKVAEFLDGLDEAEPPIPADERLLAALGPRMLELAAARTAGAHPYLVTPEHTERARQIMGDGPLLAPGQKAVLETDPARARAIARDALQVYLRAPSYVANLFRLGFTGDDISQASDRLIDALVVWGDEAAIARRVAEHHAAGADHVCVQVLTGEPTLPRPQWRALAPALMPA
jgi:probable F420-dependent oxidoreductase